MPAPPITSANPTAPGPFSGQPPQYSPLQIYGQLGAFTPANADTEFAALSVTTEHFRQMMRLLVRDDWAGQTGLGLLKDATVGLSALTAGALAALATPGAAPDLSKLGRAISVFDYLTADQIASVKAFDYRYNLSSAFRQASADIMKQGGGKLVVPYGGYLVGEQVLTGAFGQNRSWRPLDTIAINGCQRPVWIEFQGALLRTDPTNRFGSFYPTTGLAYAPPAGGFYNYDYAAWIAPHVSLTNNAAVIVSGDYELDGNIAGLNLGGYWGDVAYQCGAYGIYAYGNEYTDISGFYSHHHGLDGIAVGYPGLTDAMGWKPMRIDGRSEYNGRQGLTLAGSNGVVVRGKFSNTGRARFATSPAAGIDIEPDTINRNVDLLVECVNNVGCGIISDSGDSARIILRSGSRIVGTTNYALWPNKPGWIIEGATIVGAITNVYPGTRFSGTFITDEAKYSPSGQVYLPGAGMRLLMDVSGAGATYDRCTINATTSKVQIKNGVIKDTTITFGAGPAVNGVLPAQGTDFFPDQDYLALVWGSTLNGLNIIDNIAAAKAPANAYYIGFNGNETVQGSNTLTSPNGKINWYSWSPGAGGYNGTIVVPQIQKGVGGNFSQISQGPGFGGVATRTQAAEALYLPATSTFSAQAVTDSAPGTPLGGIEHNWAGGAAGAAKPLNWLRVGVGSNATDATDPGAYFFKALGTIEWHALNGHTVKVNGVAILNVTSAGAAVTGGLTASASSTLAGVANTGNFTNTGNATVTGTISTGNATVNALTSVNGITGNGAVISAATGIGVRVNVPAAAATSANEALSVRPNGVLGFMVDGTGTMNSSVGATFSTPAGSTTTPLTINTVAGANPGFLLAVQYQGAYQFYVAPGGVTRAYGSTSIGGALTVSGIVTSTVRAVTYVLNGAVTDISQYWIDPTATTNVATMNGAGKLFVAAGVQLSAASDTLSAYTTTTNFTPALAGSTGGGTPVITSNNGSSYGVIGNRCFVASDVNSSGANGATGVVQVQLPKVAARYGRIPVEIVTGCAVVNQRTFWLATTAGSALAVLTYSDTAGNLSSITWTNFTGALRLAFTGPYDI